MVKRKQDELVTRVAAKEAAAERISRRARSFFTLALEHKECGL